MKKQWCAVLAGLLMLSGCAAAPEEVWETVDDPILMEAVSAFSEAYRMRVSIPEQTQCVQQDETRQLWQAESGDYTVESRVLLADDAESAAHMLTGKDWQQLHPIRTTRFGLPEYRFVWYEAEEGLLCRAALLTDLDYCYALVFRSREDCSGSYDTMSEEIFASLDLFFDEGF